MNWSKHTLLVGLALVMNLCLSFSCPFLVLPGKVGMNGFRTNILHFVAASTKVDERFSEKSAPATLHTFPRGTAKSGRLVSTTLGKEDRPRPGKCGNENVLICHNLFAYTRQTECHNSSQERRKALLWILNCVLGIAAPPFLQNRRLWLRGCTQPWVQQGTVAVATCFGFVRA